MWGMSGRQTRCACYAIMAVMVAADPWMSLGPMLFLILMDAIEG